MICGAVPSMVRSVELYSSYGGKFVLINDQGRVFAAEKKTYEEKYCKFCSSFMQESCLPDSLKRIKSRKHWALKMVWNLWLTLSKGLTLLHTCAWLCWVCRGRKGHLFARIFFSTQHCRRCSSYAWPDLSRLLMMIALKEMILVEM